MQHFTLKLSLLSLLVVLGLALAACQASAGEPLTLAEEVIPLQPGQPVRVEVNNGKVTIRGTDSTYLVVSGQIADRTRTEYTTRHESAGVEILATTHQTPFAFSQEPPIELEILAPQGISLTLVTFDSLIQIEDLQGQIKVDSAAGDVEGHNLQGRVALRSGRGDVTCTACTGEVRVVGEHGLLTITESRGQIGVTTIMGTIHFNGQLLAGDSLHIEVDHGPVRVEALPGSSAAVTVESTSGVVVCPSRFGGTSRKCAGKLGEGAGAVYIRTVSGDVNLKASP